MIAAVAEKGAGKGGGLRLLGTLLFLVLVSAALLAIPAIWAH
jgi:hypothetical protein